MLFARKTNHFYRNLAQDKSLEIAHILPSILASSLHEVRFPIDGNSHFFLIFYKSHFFLKL